MIEYSIDNGATWTTVVPAAAHSGAGGSYNWTVPDTPSETCLVRITDNSSDEGPSDVSDAVFTIEHEREGKSEEVEFQFKWER